MSPTPIATGSSLQSGDKVPVRTKQVQSHPAPTSYAPQACPNTTPFTTSIPRRPITGYRLPPAPSAPAHTNVQACEHVHARRHDSLVHMRACSLARTCPPRCATLARPSLPPRPLCHLAISGTCTRTTRCAVAVVAPALVLTLTLAITPLPSPRGPRLRPPPAQRRASNNTMHAIARVVVPSPLSSSSSSLPSPPLQPILSHHPVTHYSTNAPVHACTQTHWSVCAHALARSSTLAHPIAA